MYSSIGAFLLSLTNTTIQNGIAPSVLSNYLLHRFMLMGHKRLIQLVIKFGKLVFIIINLLN